MSVIIMARRLEKKHLGRSQKCILIDVSYLFTVYLFTIL